MSSVQVAGPAYVQAQDQMSEHVWHDRASPPRLRADQAGSAPGWTSGARTHHGPEERDAEHPVEPRRQRGAVTSPLQRCTGPRAGAWGSMAVVSASGWSEDIATNRAAPLPSCTAYHCRLLLHDARQHRQKRDACDLHVPHTELKHGGGKPWLRRGQGRIDGTVKRHLPRSSIGVTPTARTADR